MHAALTLWAVAATFVPSNEAANIRRGGHLHLSTPASATIDAALRARTEVTRFGPGNCISTWRNEDGHCEVETHCKDQDISTYPVKFVCIDAGGEKVRHVFGKGSFDSEEQFDTLIECKKCLAEKQEKIEVIADVPPSGPPKPAQEPDELGGAPLKELRSEVKSLEGFMRSTSAAIQELNRKVYSESYKPKVGQAPAPAAAPSSFVHHNTVHHEQKSTMVQPSVVEPLRLKAQALRVKEEHKKQLDEDDEAEVPPTKAVKKVEAEDPSMAGVLKASEERDNVVAAQQPARTSMVSHEDEQYDSEDDRNADEEKPIPQSADEAEREESKPSISALQQSKDDDDGDDTSGEDDGDSNADTEDDESSTDDEAAETDEEETSQGDEDESE